MFPTPSRYLSLLITLIITGVAKANEQCGQQDIIKCAKPLQVLSETSELRFVSKKEELQQLCPDLFIGLRCIQEYTRRCMSVDQRAHFGRLYRGTSSAIRELCTEGKYQERFLQHASCMAKVKPQYEMCASDYQKAIAGIHTTNATYQQSDDKIKTICCSFQAYISCSVSTVRMECGDDSADFTREFLHKLGDTFIKMHCRDYPSGSDQCSGFIYGSSTPLSLSTALTLLSSLLALLYQRNYHILYY